jgi:hypothetical protein
MAVSQEFSIPQGTSLARSDERFFAKVNPQIPLDPPAISSRRCMQKAQIVCMDVTLTKLQVWPAWQKMKRISVSAVHEDSATGTRIDDFCQTLARSLGVNCEICKELWPLTQLRTPNLRAIAAGEAAAADLVVISVHHAETLPGEMKSWIDLWVKRKRTRPTVLSALFDSLHVGSSSSIQTFLQGVARKGNMEFLACSEEKPVE